MPEKKKCDNPSCIQLTTNPRFCSKSCSAKIANLIPKRKRTSPKSRYSCITCGAPVPVLRKHCRDCYYSSREDWDRILLKDIHQKASYQKSAVIRNIARRFYEQSGRSKTCVVCGYSKHVEICHISPISSFPEDTPVGKVNALDNLVALCRNCHWELDHGLLEL